MFNKIRLVIVSLLFIVQTAAYSEGSAASTASIDLSSQGIGKIVSGSMDISRANMQLSVASVKVVDNIAYITLKTSANALTTTVAVSTKLMGSSLVSVGQSIQVSTTAAGQLLSAGGKIIAFIPNSLGESLIYSKIV